MLYAMTNRAVFIAAGPDRHGWVDEVSQYLFERGGNLEDSRMAKLGGQFALMAIITGPAEALSAIERDLDLLRNNADLMAQLRECPEGLPPEQADQLIRPNSRLYLMRASGADQAGVMHQLSHLLRSLHVNIENVHTRIVRALSPEGKPLPRFEMDMIVELPPELPVSKLREYVGHLWTGRGISWELSGATTASDAAAD